MADSTVTGNTLTDPDVTLKVAGQVHRGWTSVSITRSIETIAGSFALKLTDWDPARRTLVQIEPGSPAEIAVDGETVITGYVDDAGADLDPQTHTVTVAGRDATGDLVDCAAWVPGKGTSIWAASASPIGIIGAIAKPFGITVKADVAVKSLAQWELQPGETAFAAIDKICRASAVLAMSDGKGALVLTRGGAGGQFSRLEEGSNCEAMSGTYSFKQRFSDYWVVGQMADPEIGFGISGHATDPGVKRYRPLVVTAETPLAGTSPTQRAQWEMTVRAGRALRCTVTATGWRDDGGKLWQPNGLVPFKSAALGVDETMIIASLKHSFDEKGSTTELQLTRPDAFKLIPLGADAMFAAYL